LKNFDWTKLFEMKKTRKQNFILAKIAEKSEKYEETIKFMKNIAIMNVEFTVEERNLFSSGYVNLVNKKIFSKNILKHKISKEDENLSILLSNYQKGIEKEIQKLSNDLVSILSENILPSTHNSESKVFFLKM
jgi:lipopolysaccharide biosynthesis regulator YciM